MNRQFVRILFCLIPALLVGAAFGVIFWNKGVFVTVALGMLFLGLDVTRPQPSRGERL